MKVSGEFQQPSHILFTCLIGFICIFIGFVLSDGVDDTHGRRRMAKEKGPGREDRVSGLMRETVLRPDHVLYLDHIEELCQVRHHTD